MYEGCAALPWTEWQRLVSRLTGLVFQCLPEKGAQQEECPESRVPESLPHVRVTPTWLCTVAGVGDLRAECAERYFPSSLAPLSPSIQRRCWDSPCSVLCGLALSPVEGCSLSQGSGNPPRAGWGQLPARVVLGLAGPCRPETCFASGTFRIFATCAFLLLNPHRTDVGSHQWTPLSISSFLLYFLSYCLYCVLGDFSDLMFQMFCIFCSIHTIHFLVLSMTSSYHLVTVFGGIILSL